MPENPLAAADSATAPPPGRASWSGLLRLSLVTVPVQAYPAVSTSEAVQLNQLHRDCGQRVRYEKHCPLHGKLEADQIVKGYEYAPDQYVLVEPEELEHIRPAQDRALTLQQFVAPQELDPVRYSGRTLYLLPQGPAAHRPYRVLAEAMFQKGRWGLGRITMSGHRYPVALRPACDHLLALHVLHDPPQLRAAVSFAAQLRSEAASPQERQLAALLIDSAGGPVDWLGYRDDTAQQLERLVETKVQGREVTVTCDEPRQVLPLLDALKQSVAALQPAPPSVNSRSAPRRTA